MEASTLPVSDDLKNWLDWARKKADWYDPLINIKDDLLENVDPDFLLKRSPSNKPTDSSKLYQNIALRLGLIEKR